MAQAGDERNFAKNESPDHELPARRRRTPLNWATVAAIAAPGASSLAGLMAASAAARKRDPEPRKRQPPSRKPLADHLSETSAIEAVRS
jgi:hypothetical protein